MLMIWSMAVRNIIRNVRRSLITVAGIAIGLTALLFLWGFNDGAHNSMMQNLQETIVGSIQIHAKGFFRQPKLERTVPHVDQVVQSLKRLGVDRFSPRLRSFALAAGTENSEGLIMLGIDLRSEKMTTRLHKKVGTGRFLRPGDARTCVVGATTARNLGLKPGDDLILLAEDRYRSLAAEKFRLVGIIDSGEMGIDRGLVIVPIRYMQEMLGMQGEISEVILQIPPERLESVTTELKKQLNRNRYEILRWYDMYPMMKQWVDLENGFYYIFLSIVLLIVAAGIMNTVLMSMLDRVHEFGVMMALGCKRMHLAAIVTIESTLLGLAGIIIGVSFGLALVTFFHYQGIDLSSQMDTVARFYIDPVIRTGIDTDHLIETILAVLAASIIAALVPAWRAAHLEPVEAIRHVG